MLSENENVLYYTIKKVILNGWETDCTCLAWCLLTWQHWQKSQCKYVSKSTFFLTK